VGDYSKLTFNAMSLGWLSWLSDYTVCGTKSIYNLCV